MKETSKNHKNYPSVTGTLSSMCWIWVTFAP